MSPGHKEFTGSSSIPGCGCTNRKVLKVRSIEVDDSSYEDGLGASINTDDTEGLMHDAAMGAEEVALVVPEGVSMGHHFKPCHTEYILQNVKIHLHFL